MFLNLLTHLVFTFLLGFFHSFQIFNFYYFILQTYDDNYVFQITGNVTFLLLLHANIFDTPSQIHFFFFLNNSKEAFCFVVLCLKDYLISTISLTV